MKRSVSTCCALIASMLAAPAMAAPAPTFARDGTVHVPAFDLPPSPFSSEEARRQQAARADRPAAPAAMQNPDIAERRRQIEAMLAPQAAAMRRAYPVDIAARTMAGVPVRVFTPTGREPDARRILINVHGGGFTVCAEACAILESTPIAALGNFKVISVDYRMSPEARHPAGVEDLAEVYRELLKSYKPKQIGIYGCSAGGSLTAQAAAWLPSHGLPQAGAIGILSAGGVRFGTGDSTHIAGYIDGSFPPPLPGEKPVDMTRGYFTDADLAGSVVSPAMHPDVIAKFPPTILVTGTRAMDMTPAIVTNSALLKAGVRSTLIVGEAMGHCYVYQSDLPEAQDAFAAIVAHFRTNLN